jgi:hypothetical protein
MKVKSQQCQQVHVEIEVILAVAIVVLDFVALGFEAITAFVFDLPPTSSRTAQCSHVIVCHTYIGDPAILYVTFPVYSPDDILYNSL